jgi:hypothetical protein
VDEYEEALIVYETKCEATSAVGRGRQRGSWKADYQKFV